MASLSLLNPHSYQQDQPGLSLKFKHCNIWWLSLTLKVWDWEDCLLAVHHDIPDELIGALASKCVWILARNHHLATGQTSLDNIHWIAAGNNLQVTRKPRHECLMKIDSASQQATEILLAQHKTSCLALSQRASEQWMQSKPPKSKRQLSATSSPVSPHCCPCCEPIHMCLCGPSSKTDPWTRRSAAHESMHL